MKRLDVVCPVYREGAGMRAFHARLSMAIAGLEQDHSIRIRYVLDPSPDDSEAVLEELSQTDPRVEVLVMSRRFGHQPALMAGLDRAHGADAVVMLDSDGQHPPELIPGLVAEWQGGADIVQTLRADGSETAVMKRTTSRSFYRLLSWIGSVDLKPGAADFRLLDRRVVEVITTELTERNVFLRGLVSWLGYKVAFVPFEPQKRQHGSSNYSASALFNFALMGISSFSKAPLRLCTITGLVLAVLAVVGGLTQVVLYMLGQTTVPGWASLMFMISLIGGIQLMFLGIVGEYIGQIFDEVKGRPRYLVARRHGRPEGNAPGE